MTYSWFSSLINENGGALSPDFNSVEIPFSGKRINNKEEYQKFFNDAMKKFGVSSPDELSDEDKKDFFNWVDKNWSNS